MSKKKEDKVAQLGGRGKPIWAMLESKHSFYGIPSLMYTTLDCVNENLIFFSVKSARKSSCTDPPGQTIGCVVLRAQMG